MPGVSSDLETDIRQIALLALQTVEILASQNAVDSANRQRIAIDSIASGLTLGTITTVSSVSSVSSVSNITAIGGWDVRQFENPSNFLFNQQITDNLTFS